MASDRVQKGTEFDKECVNVAFPERLNVMTDRALIGCCCYNVARKYSKVNLIVYFKKYRRSEEKSESSFFLLGCAGCSV